MKRKNVRGAAAALSKGGAISRPRSVPGIMPGVTAFEVTCRPLSWHLRGARVRIRMGGWRFERQIPRFGIRGSFRFFGWGVGLGNTRYMYLLSSSFENMMLASFEVPYALKGLYSWVTSSS